MQLQNNGGLVSPPILSSYAQKYPTTTTQGTKYDPTNGVNNLILPSPTPHPSSSTSTNYLNQLSPRTLATLLPSLPPSSTLPEDYTQSINDHAEVLQDVQNEKADLDERTSALENAIEKLMNGLPVETRDALSGPGAVTAGTVQEGEAMAAGLDWGAIGASDGDLPVVGNEGEMDLDSFLAQYCSFFLIRHHTSPLTHDFVQQIKQQKRPIIPTSSTRPHLQQSVSPPLLQQFHHPFRHISFR